METSRWTHAGGSQHPLARIDGRPLADATLEVLLGPGNRVGAYYFQAVLRDADGERSQLLLLALHHSGPYPAHNWIEVIRLFRSARFTYKSVEISDAVLQTLFDYLCELVPQGGHIMVEYESAEWADTRLGVGCGVPPAATPLGSMLYRAGCGAAFKDWYFAEGGSEGPRKLQGFKALNEEHRRARAAEMAAELRSFRQRVPPAGCEQLWEAAGERAGALLELLTAGDRGTK